MKILKRALPLAALLFSPLLHAEEQQNVVRDAETDRAAFKTIIQLQALGYIKADPATGVLTVDANFASKSPLLTFNKNNRGGGGVD